MEMTKRRDKSEQIPLPGEGMELPQDEEITAAAKAYAEARDQFQSWSVEVTQRKEKLAALLLDKGITRAIGEGFKNIELVPGKASVKVERADEPE